jgi:hypothetical protein
MASARCRGERSLLVQRILVDQLADGAVAAAHVGQQVLHFRTDAVQAVVQLFVLEQLADVALALFDAGEQRIHAVHDGLEGCQQVGALRHQFGNVLRLEALDFAAVHDVPRGAALGDVDELVAQQVGRGDSRHRVHGDFRQVTSPAPASRIRTVRWGSPELLSATLSTEPMVMPFRRTGVLSVMPEASSR